MHTVLRQITADHRPDSAVVRELAEIFREARTTYLQFSINLHSPDEDGNFLSTVVLARDEVWTIEAEERIAGFIAFLAGWVNHLYVHPRFQRRGMGAKLLHIAKRSSLSLQLWVYAANAPAIQFYEREGFVIVERTNGENNEARRPDVRMQWSLLRTPVRI